MDDSSDKPENGLNSVATRRRALMLGAVTASAIVSVRPALAQSAASVMNCEIPVPGPHGTGMNIDAYGKLVPRDTPGFVCCHGPEIHRRTGQGCDAGQQPARHDL